MAITLTSGMRQNLFALQSTTKLMEKTQTRLSTGKRVNSALDDPINFFAAENHQQRADDLSFRKDAMGEAIQTIKAGNNGIEAITDLIASAKSTAQSALSTTSTTERAT
ncbi:MAG: flagellin, partial [Desulfobacterales bacterium]|nr:flagellin [Desulfobacterales bacterium]